MTEKPEEIGMDSKTPAVRDRVDLGHEMAGLETGRIKRFLVEGASGYAADSEEKKARREQRSLLEILLTEDPQYAALYNRVADKLDRAQSAVDRALVDINQRLESLDSALQTMRDNAGELEDGTKVFRSAEDGGIYTEDGRRLSDEEAQNADIPDGAPSWEDYRRQKEERELALRQREEIERYQREVLDPAKERMSDPNNPISKDELEDLDKRLESVLPDFAIKSYDGDIDAEMPAPDTTISAAHEIVGETALNTPDMSGAFSVASAEIPDLSNIPKFDPDYTPATRTLG